MTARPLTHRGILCFWLPLASTWLMMAVEGPYLAAIIARMSDSTVNLAAFGVAFAFAIIIEAPVIMLMTASTALVEDRQSYLALRRFAYGLSAALTLVQVGLLAPAVFDFVTRDLLGASTRRGTTDLRQPCVAAPLDLRHRLSQVQARAADPTPFDATYRLRDGSASRRDVADGASRVSVATTVRRAPGRAGAIGGRRGRGSSRAG